MRITLHSARCRSIFGFWSGPLEGAGEVTGRGFKAAMKILFISQYFHPEQFSNNSIAKDMRSRGHDVDVLTCVPNYGRSSFYSGYSNYTNRVETWHGIRIFRVRTIPRGDSKLRLLFNYLTFPIAAVFEYHRNRLPRPDLTFVSMPSPLTQALVSIYLKRRYGIPAVFWVQDIWPESVILTLNIRNRFITKILTKICDWIYRQADILLVQSAGFIARMEKSGVSVERIGVFPNSAPAAYAPLRAKAPVIGTASSFRIMFAGNIGESQDFETIVEAALRLVHLRIHWTIVGSGRHERWLREAVEKSGLSGRFTFEGRHPENDMPVFFSRADAMLVSLKDRSIFELTVPYKVQCYLACGRPIIGSINGEAAHVIARSGAGYVAPASNPDELASVIERMAALSSADREAMGAAGREFYEQNYAPDKVYGMLEGWLLSAVRKSL
jgi:glycosyltransferase involved in cell wall biosynthesis